MGKCRLISPASIPFADLSRRRSVIPTADAHGSEYVGEVDKRRAWISGFDGSAGTAIVLKDAVIMFVDSRYWVQAAKQLDENWTIVRVGSPETVDWTGFLPTLEEGTVVGMDARLVDYRSVKALQESLRSVGVELKFVEENLVDLVWGVDQPSRSAEVITTHSLRFAGPSNAFLEVLVDMKVGFAVSRGFRCRQDCESSSLSRQGRWNELPAVIATEHRLDSEPSRKRYVESSKLSGCGF